MTLDEVRELAVRILRRHAFSEAHVQAVADTLVAGERDECASTVSGGCSAASPP